MRCRSGHRIAARLALRWRGARGLRTIRDAAYMLQRVATGVRATGRLIWTSSGDAAIVDTIVDMATTSSPLTAGSDYLIQVRLTAIRYAARDTNLFEFRRLDGKPLPPYEPGAHVDVHLPS